MQQLIYLAQHYPLFIAFILDLAAGDPRWFPHPVKIIGFYADWLETRIRKKFYRHLKIGGAILNFLVVIPVFIAIYSIIHALASFSPLMGAITEIFLIYTTISPIITTLK